MTRGCLGRTVLLYTVLLLTFAAATYAQDPFEEFIREWLHRAMAGFDGVSRGFILDVAVVGETASSATLEIQYADVPMPSQMVLTAFVQDPGQMALDAFEITYTEPAGSSGASQIQVALRSQYMGQPVISEQIQVLLMNRNDGTIIDSRPFPYSRPWEPEGGSVAEATTGQPEPEGSEGKGEQAEEERVAKEYIIDPKPLGNTPKVAAQAPGGGQDDGKEEDKPIRIGELPAAKPAKELPRLVVADSSARTKIDLYKLSSQATWSNGPQILPFNGSSSDSRGFVRPLANTTLSDNKTYRSVLLTHPRWVNHGQIFGAFELTIPSNASSLEVSIGFLRGANASDGVEYRIRFYAEALRQNYLLLNQRLKFTDGVVAKTIKLPSQILGQKGKLFLIINALDTANRDWAVWVTPRIF